MWNELQFAIQFPDFPQTTAVTFVSKKLSQCCNVLQSCLTVRHVQYISALSKLSLEGILFYMFYSEFLEEVFLLQKRVAKWCEALTLKSSCLNSGWKAVFPPYIPA